MLVRRYQDVLYRHAYRMVGQPDDASDIVQRTLVNGFQKLNRCRDPERVRWLALPDRREPLQGLFEESAQGRPLARGSVGKAGIGPRETRGVEAGRGPGGERS